MKSISDWPYRSMLFVPANRADFVQKAGRSHPDAVILDLEDAIPAQGKAAARAVVAGHVRALRAAGIAPFVRINALDDAGARDIEASVTPGLCGLVLPKVADAAEVRTVDRMVAFAEGRNGLGLGEVALIGLPETAAGLRNAFEIASASSRMRGLMTPVSGPVGGDVARAVGYQATPEGLEQAYLIGKIVLDCRAAGAMFPVAGIIGAPVDDLVATERLLTRARSAGFSGAALIHPSHVPLANRIMRASPDEIGRFRRMLAAFDARVDGGDGAFRFEGAMVDLAMIKLARDALAAEERQALGGAMQ